MSSLFQRESFRRSLLWAVNIGSASVLIYILFLGANFLHARDLAAVSRNEQLHDARQHELSAEDWMLLRRSNAPFTLVDTRPRNDFAKKHLWMARNIPGIELTSRARWELPRNQTIIVACGHNATCHEKYGEALIQTPCARSRYELMRLGFKDVKILAASEDELLAKGEVLESHSIDLRLAYLNHAYE